MIVTGAGYPVAGWRAVAELSTGSGYTIAGYGTRSVPTTLAVNPIGPPAGAFLQ
jgi:hypothetical protein